MSLVGVLDRPGRDRGLHTLTFAHYSPTTLAYSLVPTVGTPLLLLLQTPRILAGGGQDPGPD